MKLIGIVFSLLLLSDFSYGQYVRYWPTGVGGNGTNEYYPKDVGRQLKGYWHLDEESGSVYLDDNVGSNNIFVETEDHIASTYPYAKRFRAAYSINSDTGNWISNDIPVDLQKDFSIGAWAYKNGPVAGAVAAYSADRTQLSVEVGFSSNVWCTIYNDIQEDIWVASSVPIISSGNGTWALLIFTFEASTNTIKIYTRRIVNGVKDDSWDIQSTSSPGFFPTMLGPQKFLIIPTIDTRFDEVMIWQYLLDESYAEVLWNDSVGRFLPFGF